MVYLDNHTETHLCGSSLEQFYLSLQESSPTSLLERYQMLYDCVGASEKDTFIFTSSGAEAVHQVHWTAFFEIARKTGKSHFITSATEDPATLASFKRLEELGCFVKFAPLNEEGQIDLEKLSEMISIRVALLSFSWANGRSGVIQPVEEIGALAKEKGVLLHIDASYTLGKIPCSLQDLTGVSYLTFSGDKMHGPKGSGGLFAKEGAPLVSLIGGLEQGGLRGGALDAPSLKALSIAASQASLFLDSMSLEIARLRDRFEAEILAAVPDAKILYKDLFRLPNVSMIAFPFVHAELLRYTLSRKGLIAAGVQSENGLSFVLSRYTTEEEMDRAARILIEAIETLRPLAEDLI